MTGREMGSHHSLSHLHPWQTGPRLQPDHKLYRFLLSRALWVCFMAQGVCFNIELRCGLWIWQLFTNKGQGHFPLVHNDEMSVFFLNASFKAIFWWPGYGCFILCALTTHPHSSLSHLESLVFSVPPNLWPPLGVYWLQLHWYSLLSFSPAGSWWEEK